MEIGIGLPNAVSGTSGEQLVEWAKRAEARGFSTLGTIDRLVYDNFEPLTALTAAAAVTERIGLTHRGHARPAARQPARGREADASASRRSPAAASPSASASVAATTTSSSPRSRWATARTARTELLETLREDWADDASARRSPAPPRILVGGAVDASYERAARYGDGWIAGGAPPEAFAEGRRAGQGCLVGGRPRGQALLACLAYFSLGDGAEENARAYLTHYYAFLGEETAGYIAGAAAKDADSVKGPRRPLRGAAATS